MAKKVSIKDVASAAGISITTVSQILNGKGNRFSNDTKAKVRRITEELGYVPDYSARRMTGNTNPIIGVIVPKLSNPFFTSFIAGVQAQSYEKNAIPIVFGSNRSTSLESYYLKVLVEQGTDGVIITNPMITHEDVNDVLRKNDIPYLLLDQKTPRENEDHIGVDDYLGGQMVAQHLINKGHQKVTVLIPNLMTTNISRRIKGFKAVFEQNGIELTDRQFIETQLSKSGGYQATDVFLATGATAAFAINDEVAIGLIRGLHERHYEVPADYSVIGYDGIDLGKYVTPKLTTVSQPVFRMGQIAAEIVLKRITNRYLKPQMVELPLELVPGESVADIGKKLKK
ncbi:ribose utilization transcriptional repressor RbsR [Paucilactobacillus sp. N302-9]